ncbi:hypothetical protein [Streptomyces sp. NPDC086023]|uniref:hypothetical protein n=1 Tax=Streptomyces sp. NPDC086023 TaxID=3365746 RepID=UPI0037D88B01
MSSKLPGKYRTRILLAVSALPLVGAGIALPAVAMEAPAAVPRQVGTLVPEQAGTLTPADADVIIDEATATAICGDGSSADSDAVKAEVKKRILEKLKAKLAG